MISARYDSFARLTSESDPKEKRRRARRTAEPFLGYESKRLVNRAERHDVKLAEFDSVQRLQVGLIPRVGAVATTFHLRSE